MQAEDRIPWPAIVGMRNRVVHACFDTDREIVWTTVSAELPLLVAGLRAALGEG